VFEVPAQFETVYNFLGASMSDSSHDVQESQPPAGPKVATRLESADEIRRVIRARRAHTAKEPATEGDTVSFRPLRRPPMALLCTLDDGREEGQWLRVRGDRVVIGRGEGDIVIPHDSMLSSKHAELSRQLEHGAYRWYLTDLQSTNGTYVRIGSSFLKHGQEFLIGSRRYRFDAAPQGGRAPSDEIEPGGEKPRRTSGWQSVSPTDLMPCIIEVTAKGEGQRLLLTGTDNRLGRNATTCSVVLANDPFVSPQHARIYRDNKGRWRLENTKSLNGTWLRIDRMSLDSTCQFQLGEQRFVLRVL